ncbi:MAG: hypothetical protein ACJ8LG_05310 [Massilia sp.]
MIAHRTFAPALLAISLLASTAPTSGQVVGLPTTGALDAQAVIANRYGSATQAATSAVAVPGGITQVSFDTAGAPAQTMVPVTFGQLFARGAVSASDTLMGKFADGTSIPLQMDVKATHEDGSVRHAVISAVVPSLQAGQMLGLALVKAGAVGSIGSSLGSALAGVTATPASLANAGFAASFTATIGGQQYSASADKLLLQQKPTSWLSGPIATEWQVAAPLKNAAGVEHPHLSARFAIRWYRAIGKARVDVTIENDWAYEPAPSNFTYDAQVTVAGKPVYAKTGLTHLHHSRWRKVFWWGDAPAVNVRQNPHYLIATRALPNYDPSLVVPEASLAALQSRWTGPQTEPMGTGLAMPAMPTTGGRDDIGLLPSWAAMYLLSMDRRARDATLGTANLAGSWSAHYRDKRTGRPVSLLDYPYMTIWGHPGDTVNPATGKQEAFPPCATATGCASPNIHDSSHQPAFAYLPYLLTGDYYYLEELQFWAMWNVFSSNPAYRQNIKGLVSPDQVRGQAWSLRTLGEAAYITPDSDPLKSHFTKILANNLNWYNSTYTNNPAANGLGALAHGYAFAYKDGRGIAPWQDDFFTSAVGHVADLGFAQAVPLLAWKSKFPVARMVGAGACWIEGASYTYVVRDSATSPVYNTIGQAYAATVTPEFKALPCAGPEMAAALKLQVGEMTGYSSSPAGFPSNMQPALAYAATAAGAAGQGAWAQFMARSVKPNYAGSPQFAIVPR